MLVPTSVGTLFLSPVPTRRGGLWDSELRMDESTEPFLAFFSSLLSSRASGHAQSISDAATAFLLDAERTNCQWSRESSKCIVMSSAGQTCEVPFITFHMFMLRKCLFMSRFKAKHAAEDFVQQECSEGPTCGFKSRARQGKYCRISDGMQSLACASVEAKAMASCGSCYGPGRERQPLDASLLSLFDVSPIDHEDMEAVRGTQKGARLLHEARVEDGVTAAVVKALSICSFEEAIREFHAVCNRVPRSAPARCNLGAAYFERGDEDAALHWFREAYRMDERSSRILRAVAVLEQRAGNFSEALWLLRNYLQEVDEFNMQVQHQLACLHRERHQWAQAAACYRRLLKADPSNRDYARELQSCLDRAPLEGDFWARGDRPTKFVMEKYARAPSQEVRVWDARGPDRGRV
eukprot:s1329_g15.t1